MEGDGLPEKIREKNGQHFPLKHIEKLADPRRRVSGSAISIPIRFLISYISASGLDPSRAPKAKQAGDRERERDREKERKKDLGEKVRV